MVCSYLLYLFFSVTFFRSKSRAGWFDGFVQSVALLLWLLLFDRHQQKKKQKKKHFDRKSLALSTGFGRLAVACTLVNFFISRRISASKYLPSKFKRCDWFRSRCHQQRHFRPQKNTPLANGKKYFRSSFAIFLKSSLNLISFTLCCVHAFVLFLGRCLSAIIWSLSSECVFFCRYFIGLLDKIASLLYYMLYTSKQLNCAGIQSLSECSQDVYN